MLMFQGEEDTVVLPTWAEASRDAMLSHCIPVTPPPPSHESPCRRRPVMPKAVMPKAVRPWA